MLQQEPQEETPPQPAAQKRVTAEELASAINALEADKQREASRLAGTVEIGAVVEEMGLDATPDQVWAQVEKQRADAAEKAAVGPAPHALHQAAAEAREAGARAYAAATTPAAARRRVRGWRGIKGWAWVLFWCSGGLGLFSAIPHLLHPTPPNTIAVSGDGQTLTSATLGKNVEVSGDKDTLTLQGNCPTLTITGDNNRVRVSGTVSRIVTDGDGNVVTYVSGRGAAPALSGDGDRNTVAPAP